MLSSISVAHTSMNTSILSTTKRSGRGDATDGEPEEHYTNFVLITAVSDVCKNLREHIHHDGRSPVG